MTLSVLEHLSLAIETADLWKNLNTEVNYNFIQTNPVAAVRGLELNTKLIAKQNPQMLQQGYHRAPALDGYIAWLKAFQVLDTELTAQNHQAINRALSLMDKMRDDTVWISGMKEDRATIKAAEQADLLRKNGELFLLSGYNGHFNITRLRKLADGSTSYTLYDSGAETRVIGERIDEDGQPRLLVNAMEERRLKPSTDIEAFIKANLMKLKVSTSNEKYQIYKNFIDQSLEGKPISSVVEYAQRRGNCTTRGQRIMIADILGDPDVSKRLYEFITDDATTPFGVQRQISQCVKDLENNVKVPNNNPTPDLGWNNYDSSAYGETMRFGTPFPSSLDKRQVTNDMIHFQKDMTDKGVVVVWAWRGDNAFAYVKKTDTQSINNLMKHLEGNQQPSFKDWQDYMSGALGACLRCNTSFSMIHNQAESARQMKILETSLKEKGINISWASRNNAMHAYILKTDTVSFNNFDRELLKERLSESSTHTIASNNGDIVMIAGRPRELTDLQAHLSRHNITSVIEKPESSFGAGLRIKSASMAAYKALTAKPKAIHDPAPNIVNNTPMPRAKRGLNLRM